MKKLFYTIIISLFIIPAQVRCQTIPVVDSTYIKRIMSDLNIDMTIAVKVCAAMRTNEANIQAIIKNKTLSQQEKQQQFMTLNSEKEQRVRALLNAEQMEKLSRSIMKYIGKKHLMRQDSIWALKQQERSLQRQDSKKTQETEAPVSQ